MNLIKKRRSRFLFGIPGYAAVPFWIDFLINMFTYYGTRMINSGRFHYDLTTPWDRMIPADGWWVIIYFGCYLFWIEGFILVAREDDETCFRLLGGNMIGKLLVTAIFLLIPTTIARPQITGSGLDDAMLIMLYWLDEPNNLLPSLHCYMSWYVCRWLGRRKNHTHAGMILAWIFCFMIFYSTLATRQHYLVDIVAGVAVAEMALAAEKWFRPGRIYRWVDNRIKD